MRLHRPRQGFLLFVLLVVGVTCAISLKMYDHRRCVNRCVQLKAETTEALCNWRCTYGS